MRERKNRRKGAVRPAAAALLLILSLVVSGALPEGELSTKLLARILDPGSQSEGLPAPETGEEEQPLPPAEEIPAPPEERAPAFPALSLFGLLEAPEEEQPNRPEQWSPVRYEIRGEDLELKNDTNLRLSLADYLREISLPLADDGPQILIIHTHGTEAYTMEGEDRYTPTDLARTTDPNCNMIRVGEEMKMVFEQMGLSVLHDTALYDYPSYTGSYARSLEGIRKALEEHPTISVVLDVHRDALTDSAGNSIPMTTLLDGEQTAQVMLVLGSQESGLSHPNWEENLSLAAAIQQRLMALEPDFPRPLNLRGQRFNQHMTTGSLLVEVGTHGNTLQQALRGARAFAAAAGSVLLEQGGE